MSARPSRRELLLITLGVAALRGGSVASGGPAGSGGGGSAALDEPPLEALATLGRAWLAEHPGATAPELRAAVAEVLGPWDPGAPLPRSRVVSAIERELAEGTTVTVGGWVVARTTARLGALVALATWSGR